ncbi:RluA family pseudouridine synthase [Borreliella garinii]|uniref:RluA family pseudouridine synthase n=1 Tax=Borreliella garinii TaxID=29519 RepID=UPI00018E26F4|nr:RluA family pseudouridine synthase [Borreliella garinii]EED29824.1 RNA pseudouridine synthase family protein [Borreliella garinii Far04]WNZ66997.1 RluA family pseudouridine synthase [Borreliella garinii]WNZ67994.1 RluA family pseudouridine synthase [Borreliella garinii]WNZ68988.1 RluA family pseudouridine synthase [Borreliella garinii]WNZ69990.1 RluA family pseudouridine synthase [Borreliella garinii]
MRLDKYILLEVLDNDNGKRLDSILIKILNFSKARIIKHIRKGDIRLNGLKPSFSYRVCKGDKIYLYKSLVQNLHLAMGECYKSNIDFQCIRKRIIYEDSDLLVMDKQRGILVHGGKNSLDFLVNSYLLREDLRSLSFKPSAVHRLDRNTSGIIIFAKNINVARKLSAAFSSGSVTKKYFAILLGEVKSTVIYKNHLFRNQRLKKTFVLEDKDSINAITKVNPILSSKRATLAEIVIETGFTHQIRSQCSFNEHPLINDKKYYNKFKKSDYFLHAFLVKFNETFFKKNEFYAKPSLEFLKQVKDIFGVYEFSEFLK